MKTVLDFSILLLLLLLNGSFKLCKVSQAQGNICMYVCVYIYILYMYVCVYIYIYIYIYIRNIQTLT